MVQSPSWEANWFPATQEIPRISRNPKVHYRTHERPPPVSILGQPNPVHIPTSHLLEIHPNIIHPSTPRFPQWSPSLRFPQQDITFTNAASSKGVSTHNLLTLLALESSGKFGVKVKRSKWMALVRSLIIVWLHIWMDKSVFINWLRCTITKYKVMRAARDNVRFLLCVVRVKLFTNIQTKQFFSK